MTRAARNLTLAVALPAFGLIVTFNVWILR